MLVNKHIFTANMHNDEENSAFPGGMFEVGRIARRESYFGRHYCIHLSLVLFMAGIYPCLIKVKYSLSLTTVV